MSTLFQTHRLSPGEKQEILTILINLSQIIIVKIWTSSAFVYVLKVKRLRVVLNNFFRCERYYCLLVSVMVRIPHHLQTLSPVLMISSTPGAFFFKFVLKTKKASVQKNIKIPVRARKRQKMYLGLSYQGDWNSRKKAGVKKVTVCFHKRSKEPSSVLCVTARNIVRRSVLGPVHDIT